MYFEDCYKNWMNLEQSLLQRKCSINVSYYLHSKPFNNTANKNLLVKLGCLFSSEFSSYLSTLQLSTALPLNTYAHLDKPLYVPASLSAKWVLTE